MTGSNYGFNSTIQRSVGGEFWYEKRFLNRDSALPDGYFLAGGQSCLIAICRYLQEMHISKFLLPSYLCPALLDVFDGQGFSYQFYDLLQDFSVDLFDLEGKLSLDQAVYFIDFFGQSLAKREHDFFLKLKREGFLTVEDSAHSFEAGQTGCFSFNSLRKLVPFSGAFLRSDRDISHIIDKLEVNHAYYGAVRKARALKTAFMLHGAGSEEAYLEAFRASEKLYLYAPSAGDEEEKRAVSGLDILKIKARRIDNYQYLWAKLKPVKSITPVFSIPYDRAPLGLPVYVDRAVRNRLRSGLCVKKIFLPVHWDLVGDQRISSSLAREMSSRIITLIIDQRCEQKDLDRVFDEIIKVTGGL